MSKNVKILIVVIAAIAVVIGGAFYFKNSENFGGRIKLASSGGSQLAVNKDAEYFIDNAYGRCAKAYLEANASDEIDCMSLLISGAISVDGPAAGKSRSADDVMCERLRNAWAAGDWSARAHRPRVIPDACELFVDSDYGYSYIWNIPTLTLKRCERVARTWEKGDWTYRYGSAQLPSWCVNLFGYDID